MTIARAIWAAGAIAALALAATAQALGDIPGDPLVGVVVTAVANADGKTETERTNEFGVATFPSVKAGKYRISVAIHRAHLPKIASGQPTVLRVSAAPDEASIKVYITTHNVAAGTVRLPAGGPYAASIQVDNEYPQVVRVLVTMVPKH